MDVVIDDGTHYTYQVTYDDGELKLLNDRDQPDPDTLRR